ncbi:MAG: M14 family metallopeptidase [bacterium]
MKRIASVVSIFILSCIVLAALSSGVQAQVKKDVTESALKAMGAPNNPKVEVAWNRYYDTKQLYEIMKRIEKAYPKLAKVSSIGKSFQGKDMWMITVSNFEKGDVDKKPAMYIDGNIHSNEIQGSEVALYTAWYVTELYDKVEWIRNLLDEKTLYIVPTINPDARDHFIHKPNTASSPRSGLDPRDDDGDGLIDEDGPDDLDGDGNITQMRIRDPYGRYVADPDDPRIMVPVEAGKQGEFTLLGSEGIDNDGDGEVNEDGPGSYDPNRDWAWNWAPRYIQSGADRYPFIFPENRSIAEFVLSRPNIAAAQSYHNSGGMILRGPGTEQDLRYFSGTDVQTYDNLGKVGEEMLPGYKYMILYRDLYTVYGGEIDWFACARGIITFSNELWTSFDYFRKPPQTGTEGRGSGRTDQYRFDKLLLFEEGIVPWKKYNHPVYGEIEIGGFKKAWTRTAPSFMLEDLCHRNMAFTLFHLYHTPKVEIDSIYTRSLAGGLTEVNAVVRNTRIIPTRTNQDARNDISRHDWVTIEGGKAVAAFIVQNRFTGVTTEQKHNPQRIELESINGMGTVYVRWIVEGKGPYTVTIDSEKGGKHSLRSK